MSNNLYETERKTFFYLCEDVVKKYCKYLFNVDFKSMYSMEELSNEHMQIEYKFRLPWNYSDDPCDNGVLEIGYNLENSSLFKKLYHVAMNDKNLGYYGGVIIHSKYSIAPDAPIILHATNEIGCGAMSSSRQDIFLDNNFKDVYKNGLEEIQKILRKCL